jgi:type IV pilus assembly protein PilO
MGARNIARIWVIAGAAAIALLTVASWFLLISPKYAEADDVRTQVDGTQAQLIALRKKIAGLEEQKSRLSTYKAALEANQRALPADSGVPDFLRQLQASGEATGVKVSGVSVAPPVQSAGVSGVWQLPITLTAEGGADNLGAFLNRLQAVQPRAVLVQTANLTQEGGTSDSGDTSGSTPSLNLSLLAYVSPPAGTGAPIVTTK